MRTLNRHCKYLFICYLAVLSTVAFGQRSMLHKGKPSVVFELNRGGRQGLYLNIVERIEDRGEIGLRFQIMHLPCKGHLDVFASRLVYDPLYSPGCSKGAFDVHWPLSNDSVKLPSAWRNYLLISLPNRAFDVRPLWDNGSEKVSFGSDGPFSRYLFLALTDFRSADQQFQRLTAALEPARTRLAVPEPAQQTQHTANAAFRNAITFENRSGTDAVVKLIGRTAQSVQVADDQRVTISVDTGEYLLLARYGRNSSEYAYSRGGPVKVAETETQHSAVKITLYKPSKDDPVARKEFEVATVAQAAITHRSAIPGTERNNPKDALKYVWIPPGIFQMGCSGGDAGCQDNEKPQHTVSLTEGFWMGQTEVTVDAYKRFAVNTGRTLPLPPRFNPVWNGDLLPIVNITWDESQAFCAWAGGRLPTEAEWEYAARAGTQAARYGPVDEIAWYGDNSGARRLDVEQLFAEIKKRHKKPQKQAEELMNALAANGNMPHEVAQKSPNAFKLFDMLGNAYEWISDWYGDYDGSPTDNPKGPSDGQYRLLRGGDWANFPILVRVSVRAGIKPDVRRDTIGFRCVLPGDQSPTSTIP